MMVLAHLWSLGNCYQRNLLLICAAWRPRELTSITHISKLYVVIFLSMQETFQQQLEGFFLFHQPLLMTAGAGGGQLST